MKEKMIRAGKTLEGIILWECPCAAEIPEDDDPGEFWPCNENGELQRLTPRYMLQLEWCGCGRIFNCHTGEVMGNLRVHKRITSRCLDLRSILVARVDGVVPLRTDRMIVNVEGCHLVIRHLLSRLIGGRHQMRLHRQPRLRGGERNVVEY